MRTRFTAEQRENPDIVESEAQLRRCVHCGFCTAACPTYVLEGNELDSPRGRIMLIQNMLEQGEAPLAETVFHIDRCLSCLACTKACPSGVDYGRLIDLGRAHIEKTYRRPLIDRLMRKAIGRVLPDPSLFGPALALGRFAKPLAPLLPERVRAMLDLVPEEGPGAGVAPGRYPAQGPAKQRLVLFPGCLQDRLAPAINAAAVRVLTKLGAEVIVPQGAPCCGALTHHLGDHDETLRLARGTIDALGPHLSDPIDGIVTSAAGCGTLLKDYAHLCAREPSLAPFAAKLAGSVLDISQAIDRLGLPPGITPVETVTLAYQSACSLNHGQDLDALPRRLLTESGFRVVTLSEAHLCCGSAGTYNMLEPELSGELRARKADAIEQTEADAVASGNIGCIMQLRPALAIPIAHTIEWLDWALGGPEPGA